MTTGETDRLPSAGDSGEMPLMIARFVIEDELGAGGMGRVYVAYDPTLDRRVAIKVLRDRLGVDVDRAHERMAREARAMARLHHPHVVTVHEVGTDKRGVYIVMEYVAGQTLRAWLERVPAPSWRDIVAMYVVAGRGLAAAHAAGLVHRDFKPDNVLVGDDGRVLVSDFGIANIYGIESSTETPSGEPTPARLTRAGSVVGTLPYMSPEQHAGSPVDARTDQFAFCAALYEALYGARPFAGETSTEIAERARRGEVTPPAHDRGAPARVRGAILRGLSGNPDERFPTITALLAELAPEHRPARRGLAVAAGVVLASAFALWLAVRPHAPPLAPAPPIGPIAVEPVRTTLAYGDRAEWRQSVGDVIALLLADIDGFKAVGPSNLLTGDHPDLNAAEAGIAASYIVRGSIDRHGDRVYATVQLVRPDGLAFAIAVDRPVAELANLLEDVTNRIAETIAPGHHLERAHAAIRAHALYAIGDDHLRNDRFQLAWPFLEQAVIADPKFFEGWYELALARSWVLAPETAVFEAVDAARATAPSEVERALVAGLSSYLHHDLAAAREVLEPLASNPALSKTELRDALYLLGEAHWHDGHHRLGVGYFRRALDLDMTFKLPVQHLGEYAMANRDAAMLQQYSLMVSSSASDYRSFADLMLGHYEQVAQTGVPPTRLYATLLLGRTPSPELEAELAGDAIVSDIYRTARALEAGDRATAHAEIAEIWKQVSARETAGEVPDSVYYLLRLLGDVIVCGGMTDEARTLVQFLAEHSRARPVRNYQRMSILVAPLVGDRSLIVRRNLTDRDRQLADAIDAEMSGDHAKAVDLLEAIVRDPSPYWDYPERVALLRNLRALHRGKEARALCEDTMHPAEFQLAFLPTRRACAAR